jgi:hypothetical protein
MTIHIKKSVLEIVNFLFNHNFVFMAIGIINKRIKLIESIFLAYPANEKYALSYAYRYRLKYNRWNPWLTGLLFQNSKIIIMFSISATEEILMMEDDKLKILEKKMERIKDLLFVKTKTYAGILPGILFSKRIIRVVPEADLTAKAVTQAILEIQKIECLDELPIIVLGGRGFIGRRVMSQLTNRVVHCVDLSDSGKNQWPNIDKAIVINISKKGALDNYIKLMSPRMIVINEVYPEPSKYELMRLKGKGCLCYHIAGIKAKAFPSFPDAYKGGIPCCAAWLSEKMKVIVKKINCEN